MREERGCGDKGCLGGELYQTPWALRDCGDEPEIDREHATPAFGNVTCSVQPFSFIVAAYGELANEYSASCVPPTLCSHVAQTLEPDITICGWSFCTSVVAPVP